MSSLPRFAFILALIFSCAVFRIAAHSQTTTPKKAMTNSVSGRITIHGKGAAGIVVGIHNSNFSRQPAPALKLQQTRTAITESLTYRPVTTKCRL
jgi:hypothetical protein